MNLLQNEPFAEISRIAMQFADSLDTILADIQFSGDGAPVGITRLQTEQDRRVWMDYLSRSSRREQDGTQPGNVATAAVSHPAVQEQIDANS